jgi:hypothetical protein
MTLEPPNPYSVNIVIPILDPGGIAIAETRIH